MIVRLNGGTANQMFQYAFGRSVGLVRKETVFFKPQDLGEGCHRAYSLNVFNADVKMWDGRRMGPTFTEQLSEFRYNPAVYTQPRDTFFIGNWQTEKYFDEAVVRRELSLRNPVSDETNRVAEDILAGAPAAFVHVRRTDYTIPHVAAYHGNMTMSYYQKAIAYIQERVENVRFYIFSDDPDWCRANFPNMRVVGHNKMGSGNTGVGTEHEDLFLMSLCNHAIIPNSSFGWFGAWFGDTRRPRIVVAPQVWFLNPQLTYQDVVPQRWVKLSNEANS